ncbi:LacI family DNA-binding transcriptional regulator [Crystallibacter crystallopoietes]|uniref:LacI family DNA-binding transcriptional regulator n=1 Tax=Crystallibacter crystallopoietes TaxID=37928 RepID=UPI0009DAB511|nr:LacI family DNA-binding transcriptional regulator [Arthrobacter crystallopoietes]
MGSLFKPTIRDVAEKAGVSLATVSYVLSGRSGGSTRISEPTKERVLQAAKDLGYVPNRAAQGMRRGRTDTVAVVIESMESPWDRALVETANQILPAHGLRVVILLGQDAWRNFMLSGGADGVILGFSTETEEEIRTIEDLARRGVAQVVVSQFLEPKGFDVLSIDAEGGVAEAAKYLSERHQRIGVIHRGLSGNGPRGTRLELFRNAMEKLGVELDERLIRASGGNWRSAVSDALELLSLPDPPTAFWTTADMEALCVFGAATWKGLSIPEDLEIIGVENSELGRESNPPLSTVGPDPSEHLAVDLLLQRLQGKAPQEGRRVPVPWKLHLRGTTAHAASEPNDNGTPIVGAGTGS